MFFLMSLMACLKEKIRRKISLGKYTNNLNLIPKLEEPYGKSDTLIYVYMKSTVNKSMNVYAHMHTYLHQLQVMANIIKTFPMLNKQEFQYDDTSPSCLALSFFVMLAKHNVLVLLRNEWYLSVHLLSICSA